MSADAHTPAWSQADERFIVEVPELPGCMADGTTCEEAIANAQSVVQEWIDTARSLGRPIPEPKGKWPMTRQELKELSATDKKLIKNLVKELGEISG